MNEVCIKGALLRYKPDGRLARFERKAKRIYKKKLVTVYVGKLVDGAGRLMAQAKDWEVVRENSA